jgi:beta-lactamase regulating signal transducer with metallopeptidase domain
MTNHLWQSTIFAVAAGLLTFALRRNRAQVRYWLWLSASLKFFVPFALLMSLGSHVPWGAVTRTVAAPPAVRFAMEQIAQPFPDPVPLAPSTRNRDWFPIAIFTLWACGLLGVALIRFRGWLRVRAALRASTRLPDRAQHQVQAVRSLDIPAPVEIRSSPGLLEPGVVGVLRPVLLLPEGITRRLTPPQLEAVLAHELCHIHRRDNLFAAVHMMVEAAFWFHPLVWWIGARLVEERERACDEEVLRLGSEPRVYAEAILNVCKLYVESPLACVSGVTGSNIKHRIEAIMTNRIVFRLTFGKKLALAVAGMAALAGPIFVGMMNAPGVLGQSRPQSQPPAASPAIDAAPVKPSRTAQLIAQAQPAPLPGGRGMAPQPAPAATPPAGLPPAQALQMDRIAARYGPPDQIDDRSSDAQNPSLIWRYNYLEDFRSNVEFEFAQGKPMHINWPVPVTYEGRPGDSVGLVPTLSSEFFLVGDHAAANIIAGLPGGHASMQIYPARQYRILSVPMDSLSGPVDIVGVIRTGSGKTSQGVRDYIKAAPAGPYTANFTLDPGSYVGSVIVKEQATGRMFGETINFEVK